jgi:3-deoxy-7-phosphoheptulonate synthase
MALAAAAAGADGVMVEVHIHPPSALSDGPQSLFPEQMLALGRQLDAMLGLLGRSL